jgi:membrane protease YdiL (CAAX protease family)
MRVPAAARSGSFVAVSVSLSILSAAIAYTYSGRYGLSQSASIGIYLAFVLLLILGLAPAWSTSRRTRSRRVFLFIPLWCLPYLIYAAGTGDFRWLALLKLILLAASPVWIYSRFPPRRQQMFSWQDACVATVLIGFVLTGQFRGIWNVPVNLDFMSRLFLITVATWCWTFIRPVPELGYSFRISRPVLKQAAINFALFAVIAIPSSLAMHFTRWNPKWTGPAPFLLSFLQIFLFIAVLEEIFFRGFLQTLLSKSLRSWVAGQAFVSVLFGLFHVLHPPFPNWKYVALATVAGWFYGTAFRKTGSLMTSSLVHAAVDTVWRTWLSAR